MSRISINSFAPTTTLRSRGSARCDRQPLRVPHTSSSASPRLSERRYRWATSRPPLAPSQVMTRGRALQRAAAPESASFVGMAIRQCANSRPPAPRNDRWSALSETAPQSARSGPRFSVPAVRPSRSARGPRRTAKQASHRAHDHARQGGFLRHGLTKLRESVRSNAVSKRSSPGMRVNVPFVSTIDRTAGSLLATRLRPLRLHTT